MPPSAIRQLLNTGDSLSLLRPGLSVVRANRPHLRLVEGAHTDVERTADAPSASHTERESSSRQIILQVDGLQEHATTTRREPTARYQPLIFTVVVLQSAKVYTTDTYSVIYYVICEI